eukprot:3763697-Rhodomonas_salina.2
MSALICPRVYVCGWMCAGADRAAAAGRHLGLPHHRHGLQLGVCMYVMCCFYMFKLCLYVGHLTAGKGTTMGIYNGGGWDLTLQ